MKTTFCLLFSLVFAVAAHADIQDPPANDYGPTRKLGRGLNNMIFGLAEIPFTSASLTEREGNSTAGSYGVVKGVGRAFFRFGTGVFEFVTFPFPTNKNSYRQPYRSNIPWIHGGYTEFSPELGFETHYDYSRTYGAY